MGFFSGLMLLFIGLKLAGFIAWSWWLILFPFWVLPAGGLLFWIIYFICLCVDDFVTWWKKK